MIQKVTAYASPLAISNQLSSYRLHLWSSLKYHVTQKYTARLSHQLSENPLRRMGFDVVIHKALINLIHTLQKHNLQYS